MTTSVRVWTFPNIPGEVNLNQTALHSENLLKTKSTVLPLPTLDSSTDFLLTSNLNDILHNGNISKLVSLSEIKPGKSTL